MNAIFVFCYFVLKAEPAAPHRCPFHTNAVPVLAPLELFWFGTVFYFQPPFCSHRPEPDWCCRCCVMTSPAYVADFLTNGVRALTTTTTMGDCVGSMIGLLLIIRIQSKLNNDFSNLILFSRVPWFIVY